MSGKDIYQKWGITNDVGALNKNIKATTRIGVAVKALLARKKAIDLVNNGGKNSFQYEDEQGNRYYTGQVFNKNNRQTKGQVVTPAIVDQYGNITSTPSFKDVEAVYPKVTLDRNYGSGTIGQVPYKKVKRKGGDEKYRKQCKGN